MVQFAVRQAWAWSCRTVHLSPTHGPISMGRIKSGEAASSKARDRTGRDVLRRVLEAYPPPVLRVVLGDVGRYAKYLSCWLVASPWCRALVPTVGRVW